MSAAPRVTSAWEAGALGRFADPAREFSYRRPLVSAIFVVATLLLAAIFIFRPSYDTNDDPMMSLIVAGKGVCQQPDDHMVFTHFFLGRLLKTLYIAAPLIPWYGVYLVAVHAGAHVALVYMLFKQRLGWRWVLVYLAYAGVVGLPLLCAMQFTTTAFLAVQSGMLLGWFAFLRAVDGDTRGARRCGIAGAIFMIVAAMIRWHVFMLFLSLAVPTACVLTWMYRHNRRLLLVGSGVTALVIVSLVGLAKLNDVYYSRDPRWRDFYHYNELRARINDLGWVYYSAETAHVFPQVGWSVNDLGMIQAWFYDDPAVYSAEKLQELLSAYPWKDSRPADHNLYDLFGALAQDRQVVALLALVPLIVWSLRRNKSGQLAVVITCVWIGAVLCAATLLRKPPPPRIYLPILSFPAALALFLAGLRNITPRGSGIARLTDSSVTRARKVLFRGHFAIQASCIACACFAVIDSFGAQLDRSGDKAERSEAFYIQLEKLIAEPDKLYVCWGASFPCDLLSPWDNLHWLDGLRMVQLGWPQQCPFHADMKRRFGIQDLAGELPDRPDITLICDPACLTLMSNYIRQHHGREVQFERTGALFNAALARVATTSPRVIAAGERSRRE